MKKPLLVTLADRKYLEYAKQVFAGAYFNAGWKGDYMLLAHEVPEKDLKWFRRKGILIKHCKSLYDKPLADTPIVFVSKLYLFSHEFKKWSHIIYVDVDIIIRGSLDKLLEIKGFASVANIGNTNFTNELVGNAEAKKRNLDILEYSRLIEKLKNLYSVDEKIFCAGFFALSTRLISDDIFGEIKKIIDRYYKIAVYADQLALNIYFYKQWQKLPAVYDFYISDERNQWCIVNQKIESIIIHFVGKSKPWKRKNSFHHEWSKNLKKAEEINLSKIPSGKKLSDSKIDHLEKKLARREKIFYFYFRKYLVSQFLSRSYYFFIDFFEKLSPTLFKIIKIIKRRIKKNFKSNEKTPLSDPSR